MRTTRYYFWLFFALFFVQIAPGAEADKKPPAKPAFKAGQETVIPWSGLTDDLVVYTPSNYSPEKTWPLLFYYHGANHKPGTKLMRQYTGGKDFVIVGMSYSPVPNGYVSPEKAVQHIQKELAIYKHVRRWLLHYLKIDNHRVYMAGLSRGGWQASQLGEKDIENLAGLVIVLAGRRWSQVLADNESAFTGKTIYIGVGETDPNNPFAQAAKIYYRRCGARVSFEEYPGKGHEMPPRSELLSDWFEANGRLFERTADTTNALTKWVTGALEAVEKEKDAAKKYSMLSMLRVNPKILKCSEKDIKKLAKCWDKVLAQSPAAVREWKAEQAFDKDMEIELAWVEQKKRSLAGLKRVYSGYFRTAKTYAAARYGKLARDACGRLEPIIKSYEKQIEELRRKTTPAPGNMTQPRLQWNGNMGE